MALVRALIAKAMFGTLLPAEGIVAGFCLGGLFGTWWGSHAGHGLGDLGYLFKGALAGGVAGLAVGIWGAARWDGAVRLRILVSSLLGTAVVGLGTWLAVSLHGGW